MLLKLFKKLTNFLLFKNIQFVIDDDPDSLKSEIRKWVQNSSSTSSAAFPVAEVPSSNDCLQKISKIKTILMYYLCYWCVFFCYLGLGDFIERNIEGRSLLEVYDTKQSFHNSNWPELINIETKICKLFPKEELTQVRKISLRRKELKTLNSIDFLNVWPVYTGARSPDLVS